MTEQDDPVDDEIERGTPCTITLGPRWRGKMYRRGIPAEIVDKTRWPLKSGEHVGRSFSATLLFNEPRVIEHGCGVRPLNAFCSWDADFFDTVVTVEALDEKTVTVRANGRRAATKVQVLVVAPSTQTTMVQVLVVRDERSGRLSRWWRMSRVINGKRILKWESKSYVAYELVLGAKDNGVDGRAFSRERRKTAIAALTAK